METNERNFETEQSTFNVKDRTCQKHDTNEDFVNNLFNKRFVVADDERYSLPNVEVMFVEEPWEIEYLQTLKKDLNCIKQGLDNYSLHKWHLHTSLRCYSKDVIGRIKTEIQPEFATLAWCKFYEIASTFPLIPVDQIANANRQFKSVHLCEAPGAFVVALNHWLQTNAPEIEWDWFAVTLNPYYEGHATVNLISDDRFIRHTLDHWYFGEEGTGNLMNLKFLDEVVQFSERENIYLVTADGSVDCKDVPAEQENVVAQLHLCETITALHLLSAGGSFLLKIFTIFEHRTVCLMYLLSCCFGKVTVVKPVTSKEGNSECYVVCTNFKGATFVSPYLEKFRAEYECDAGKAMFAKSDIPSAFLERIIKCSEFFKRQQCMVIENNISAFESEKNHVLHDITEIQSMVSDKYFRDCNLRKLVSGEIVGRSILKRTRTINIMKNVIEESYSERCKGGPLTPRDKLNKYLREICNVKVNIPIGEFITFTIDNVPEDLRIRSGKIFRNVRNSKFANADVMHIKNKLDDLVLTLGWKTDFPLAECVGELERKILAEPDHLVLSFRYADPHDSHKTIVQISDAFENLETGQTLVLIGYSLFTHLNVGLLYLVGCAFDSLTIKICGNVGLQINLEKYSYNVKLLHRLNLIRMSSARALEKGDSLLEVIPVNYLYDTDLYTTIVDVNHWIIKLFLCYVSYKLQKSTSSGESNK